MDAASPSSSETVLGQRLRWLAPVVVGFASAAFVFISLRGVNVRALDESNAWQGYVHDRWWLASWLLVIPLPFIAGLTWTGAWRTVACAAAPQWVLAVVISDRVMYVREHTYEGPNFPYDWAADVMSAGMTVVFALAVLGGRRFAPNLDRGAWSALRRQ